MRSTGSWSHKVRILRNKGVIELGDDRSPLVPHDVRKTIEITQGETVNLYLTVLTSSGTFPSVAFATHTWRIRKKSEPGYVRFALFGAATGAPGELLFTLTRAQTLTLTPGFYVYDIMRAEGADVEDVVPYSSLNVRPGV